MKTTQTNRWSRLPLRNGKTLRNRVVVPPMASSTSNPEGFVTDRTLEHYARLSEAQPGLLIVEYSFVHPTGRSEEKQLGIQTDAQIEGLTRLASVIRQSGALAGIQVSHGGGKSERALTGGALHGPSAIAVPVKDQTMEVPDPMTLDEIALWKASFIAASDRAVAAGFDLLEIHSAHGYGLNQWLSPITNQRADEYGGTLERRIRLLLEIIQSIRARHPELLLSVRVPGQDFLEGGLSPIDTGVLARHLERAGVDLIHVSSGIGGWRRPRDRIGEGYLVSEAARIQAEVQIPVIGVGGIESGAFIDRGLEEGWFALAAVGRAILKNPVEWKDENLLPPKAVQVS